MNQLTDKADVIAGGVSASGRAAARELMDPLIQILIKRGILTKNLDYHVIRASLVIIFLFLDIKSGLSPRHKY